MSLKILIANSQIPWGGLGQYTINLANEFRERDFAIYGLITHQTNSNIVKDFSDITKKTEYYGNLTKILKYYKIVKYIKAVKPDFVIINFLASLHYLLPFLGKTKFISVIHSDQPEFYRVAKINSSFIDAFVAPTPKVKDGFLKYTNNSKLESKIHVINHGVSLSNLPFRKINSLTFKILFAGALYKHKGVDLLPEIIFSFIKACPNSRITIAGDGDFRKSLQENIHSKVLDKYVDFKGVVSQEQLRNIYADSDVLLFPTRLESFGLVIAEAMMAGVVPVVTNLRGITDSIICNKQTGFLVDLDSIEGFVKSLTFLYNSRELLNKIANNAMSHAQTYLSSKVMADNYVDLMKSISSCRFT